MKRLIFKWKYLLASILLANNIACSNDDLNQMVSRQEYDSGTRTAELVTKTITLETEGTLEAKVIEAMGEAEVSTLEKLIVSGPFTSTDMQYIRDALTGLTILDMEGIQIKASDVPYSYVRYEYPYYNLRTWHFSENEMCNGMFSQMGHLKEVILPSSITAISSEAFYDCDSLCSVVMSDNVIMIGDRAFYDCNSLSAINLSANLEVIDNYAFSGSAIKTLVLPASMKELIGAVFLGCQSLESIEMPYGLEAIGSQCFHSCYSLRTLVVPETVTHVGDGALAYSGLRSVIWNTSIDVPNCNWGSFNNGPALLFVYNDQISVENLHEWQAIIVNDETDLTINVEYGTDFVNTKEFTAKKLKYSRYFDDSTQPGYSAGWQTIVLPFTPDSIYHETKGQIAPFGSGIEGAKPFWLRELTSEGFVDVTKIEPNKPYIIAMPNHSDYLDEYCLNGNITFIARDSVLRVTPAQLEPSIGPEFEFHPTYRTVESSSETYGLTGQWGYHDSQIYYRKNFFAKNEEVYKFNAFVTALGGGRSSRSLFDLDTRSKETRASWIPNKTGIPQIGDM